MLDCRSKKSDAISTMESTYALPERTKRGPPTNRNISIRNIKAQITNMSANENAGFKNEYLVRCDFNSPERKVPASFFLS